MYNSKRAVHVLLYIFVITISVTIFFACSDGSSSNSKDENPSGGETVNLHRDGDNLLNSEEDKNNNGIVDLGETDPDDADTDNDGENDYDEVLAGDSDGDGLSDAVESDRFEESMIGVYHDAC